MTALMPELLTRLVEMVEHRYFGKYKGQVVDNADPEGLGRLRVSVPAVLGPDVVSGWAMPCVPYGGAPGQGFFFIPEAGAGVWVEFEGGDLSHPVWVGTFWSKPGGDPEPPKPNDAGGAEADPQSPPTRKIIKTLKGHTIQLEDADGDETVLVAEATNKHLLVMNKDGIRLRDGANNHEVLLDSAGITVTDGVNAANSVKLQSGGITVEDKHGNRVLLEGGGVTVEALSVTVKSNDVVVGKGFMAEPFVLGQTFMMNVTSFLVALATHTHVGNLGAPTSPPMAPIDLQVPLSAKFKMME